MSAAARCPYNRSYLRRGLNDRGGGDAAYRNGETGRVTSPGPISTTGSDAPGDPTADPDGVGNEPVDTLVGEVPPDGAAPSVDAAAAPAAVDVEAAVEAEAAAVAERVG